MSPLTKDIIREIKNTRSRFFSILVLVALAVAFLAGLRTTAPDMEATADVYLDGTDMMDVRVVSTLGLTEGDIAALAAREGVLQAEGAYTIDGLVPAEDNSVVVKVLSLSPGGLNRPWLLSGRMPEDSGECLVEETLLSALQAGVGDAVSIHTGDGAYENTLNRETFTIVGTCNSPLYMALDRGASTLGTGKVSSVIHLMPEAFAMDAYTDAYLTLTGAKELNTYSDAYGDLIDGWLEEAEEFGEQRAELRGQEIADEAGEALADAQREYDDGAREVEEELADARRELKEARDELDNGRAELAEGWADWRQGWADLRREEAEALAEIADGERELADAFQKLTDGEADYADGERELKEGRAEYQDGLTAYQEARGEYLEGRDEYEDGRLEYLDGLKEYEEGKAELADAKRELDDAKRRLDEAANQLLAGESSYSAGRQEYEAGKAQFDAQVGQLTAGINAATGGSLTSDQLMAGLEGGDPVLTGTVDMALTGTGMTSGDLLSSKGRLDAAQRQLSSAAGSLSWGWQQYDEGYQAYTDGKREYEKGVRELEKGWAELEEARLKLEDAETELNEGWEKLEQAWAQLEHAQLDLQEGEQELADARQELDEGWADYEQGLLDLEEARQTLADEVARATQTLNDAEAGLRDGEVELADGEAEYADGVRAYEEGARDAEAELADAREKLNEARRELAELEACEWYLLSRSANVGYVSYQQDAERMGNLAAVFPLIFFLVAALVCLTTMTRMVEEQRVQIGSLKALGYSRGDIAKKYVGYGLLASLLGGLIGLAVGCTLLPWIIITAWRIMYSVPGLELPFAPAVSLLSVAGGVACTAVAVLAAALAALRATPASLMRPRAPKAGKRVLLERVKPLWRRLSFTQKVTVRNLFRYKKRFWMTVIGIGGCTALIITGFGLRDSILSIMDIQYDEIYRYQAQAGLSSGISPAESEAVTARLEGMEAVADYLLCREVTVDFSGESRTVSGSLRVVPDHDALSRFVNLRTRQGHDPVELPQEGLVLTEKLAELLKVGPGDTVVLDGDRRVMARVAAVTENYIMHYAYLTGGYYEQLYGEAPESNLLLLRYDGGPETADAISAALVGMDGVTSVTRIADTRATFTASFESVDYAVIVIIISAAALAFVVLYNLTNINITERLRELATLKVLGFRERELNAYVFRESFLLTLFGVAIGLIMGRLLHQWLVLTVEIDMLMFGRAALPMSYGYAVALTLLFSGLVSLTARRKLRRIDMVESLKTVE